ncbi:hypothetical protein HK102_000749 [Quaeritorhiza haematococci]|nr:hypothetical protein HK102_000749 [Quaeritorhiza haematococci]
MIDAIRYISDLPRAQPPSPDVNSRTVEDTLPTTVHPQVIDAWMLLASALLRSVSVAFLTIALYQQAKHRSAVDLRLLRDPTTPPLLALRTDLLTAN